LLKDVKVLVDRYSTQASADFLGSYTEHWDSAKDQYLRNSVQLGWEKLDKYYQLTDKSSAYVAAISLHPRYKWRWIEKRWEHRPSWQTTADIAIRTQWAWYKSKKVEDLLGPVDSKQYYNLRRHCEKSADLPQLEYFMEEDFQSSSDEEAGSSSDEYDIWQKLQREKALDNPIAYWHEKRLVWPHLARFALDLFGIPAMSAEPERVFSSVGRMVRPDRGSLKPDIVCAAARLKKWDKSGVISWVPE
jgi:hAT family C-terminal dimerisation region